MAAAWRNALPRLMKRSSNIFTPVRYKRGERYKKKDTWKVMLIEEETIPNFKDRVTAVTQSDPVLNPVIDISQPIPQPKKINQRRRDAEWRISRTSDDKWEKQARLRNLRLPLDEVQKDWELESAPEHVQMYCDHYNIYKDLFREAFFIPRQIMKVTYDDTEETEYVNPVYYGNILSPSQAAKSPHVEFEADPDSLWMVTMTTPDGHLTQNNHEVLHWFIGNIRGCDISKGEVVCDYILPFPPRGAGFHRYVFLLYKQDKHIDFTAQKRSQNCTSLKDRTFSTYEFYQEHQDYITPVAVSFFQSDHDDSVKTLYHNVLDMKEPCYEYDFPADWHPKQWYTPHKEPFNLYLDRYRDKKDIAEQVLRERLKKISPFEPEVKPEYPNIYQMHDKPSWQRTEEYNKRIKYWQWKDL